MAESCATECMYYDQCEHALNNHMKGSKRNPIKQKLGLYGPTERVFETAHELLEAGDACASENPRLAQECMILAVVAVNESLK